MGRSALTRFTVNVDGHLRRVFSIREEKSGRLIIDNALKGIRYSLDSELEIIESKYSVRLSQLSANYETNIHLTETLSDGSLRHRSIQTSAFRDHRFQNLYSRMMLNPRVFPVLKPNPRDTVIQLASMEPNRCALLYTVWIGSSADAEFFGKNPFYSHILQKFSRYCVAVTFGFSPYSSRQIDLLIRTSSSSDMRLTPEQRALGYKGGALPGVIPAEVWMPVTRQFNELISTPPYETSFPELQ